MKTMCSRCGEITVPIHCIMCKKGPLCTKCADLHVRICSGKNDELSMSDLLGNYSESEVRTQRTLKAPLNYPGSKRASLPELLPHLPYRGAYIEPFGGSAAVLLARNPEKLEVYNDRYGGVVEFYRCLQGANCDRLIERLDLTVHSREEWEYCFVNWQEPSEPVERAARWYYMRYYSFGGKGAAFGRNTKPQQPYAGKLRNRLLDFPEIHERLRQVQIENLDWREIIEDYDSKDAVFYMDPPYYEVENAGIYTSDMKQADHRDLLNTIFSMKGFVALSGYSNALYDDSKYNWDERITWSRRDRMDAGVCNEHNKREASFRGIKEEVLWIKDNL